MKLKAYLKQQNLTGAQLAEFAERCGTTSGQIKQVAGEFRRAGEALAINIDRETNGAVPCEELRPDVDWKYLRGTSKPGSLKVGELSEQLKAS